MSEQDMGAQERTIRFFAAVLLALVPMGMIALFDALGAHPGRTDAGGAFICSILLLGFIAYLKFTEEWNNAGPL